MRRIKHNLSINDLIRGIYEKIIVIAVLCIGMYGCDNKKGLELTSSDSYASIATKANLLDKKEDNTSVRYSSKEKLKSFNSIPFDEAYSDLSFKFSPDGKLCSISISASTEKGFSKNEVARLSNLTMQTLNIYGKYDSFTKNGFSTWEPNNENGIKYITIISMENELSTLEIVTNNERYCDPKVMEQEKKGAWSTDKSVDEIDDTKILFAKLYSQDKKQLLTLRCKNNDINFFVTSADYLGTGESLVSFRLDKDKAITSLWGIEPSNFVYYKGNSRKLFKKMLQAKKLTIRLGTYTGSVTSKFDLDKIDYATKDIVEACNINDTDAIEKEEALQGNTANQDGNQDNIAKSWTIQIAATSTRENAESFQKKLREYNYNAYIQLDNNLYRIYVGPFIQKTEALQVQKMIEKQFKAKVIISEYKPNKS